MSAQAQDKYDFTEEELLAILKQVKDWRRLLLKHPESPDHVAMLQLEKHVTLRLNEMVTKRYYKEKGLD